ncbi:hypothetical protein [Streptomyces sp. NRRL WC-3744]|uniref:hypothetical protein n=1 Tax=Streptomyces sp. NRRL WC-3744 TaxID=1463935 RepID=UPI00131DCDF9|nr:hypothetical protein [Streptomyces sp. NRRL WC-3744]
MKTPRWMPWRRRPAQAAARTIPEAARTRLTDALDISLAPQLHAEHPPPGARQLADTAHAAPLRAPHRPVRPAGRSHAWGDDPRRQENSLSTRAMTFQALT